MALLIDTTAFITLERRPGGLATLGRTVPIASGGPIAMAAITASELLVGVHRAQTESQRSRREAFVEGLLAHVPVVAFDLLCARAHARLATFLGASGAIIGAHDLLIAATALAHGFSVVTSNAKEFQRVPGLTTIELTL